MRVKMLYYILLLLLLLLLVLLLMMRMMRIIEASISRMNVRYIYSRRAIPICRM